MARVALEGVSKVFPGSVKAVDTLDLEVNDKEFVVIVGPSGCGKSTSLRLIAGLEGADEGQIFIGDEPVRDIAPKDRNIAMVFQNYALYPHMSVYKNMAFGLQLRYGGGLLSRLVRRLVQPAKARELEVQRRGIKQQVGEAAAMLNIEHLLQRMPRQLSGGERQRVALGRAIVRKPAAFLFDEPLSNLDAKLRVDMRRELKQLHQRLEVTMIYVTHDQVEALTLGQRIVVMDRGKIQQVGPPMDVYDRPANQFVAGFIGTPPMNFVQGTIRDESAQLCFDGNGFALRLETGHFEKEQMDRLHASPNRKATLGVRPEDVDVASGEGAAVGKGRVLMVESLGDAAVVHVELKAGEQESSTLVSKKQSRTPLRPNDSVEVRVDTSRMHFFDSSTGERLA